MTRNVSGNLKREVFNQQSSEVFIVLVTISHPSFSDDIRIASDSYESLPIAGVRGVVSNGLEYIFMPFNFNLPKQDDTGVAKASISIDNISRSYVAAVRNADSALSISIDVVLSSDVNSPEVSISDFRLERIEYDSMVISGDISVEYFDLEPFPSKKFTPSDFQGLF
jgi:hypothetical protein